MRGRDDRGDTYRILHVTPGGVQELAGTYLQPSYLAVLAVPEPSVGSLLLLFVLVLSKARRG